MQMWPLTVAAILRHGARIHRRSRVLTSTDDAVRGTTFPAVAAQARRLARALGDLGIGPGDRVATYQWNNVEHVEAYFAVPGLGAVLHTLNIRLPADQVAFIMSHAEDKVVIVDASLVASLAAVIGQQTAVTDVIVAGWTDDSEALRQLAGSGRTVHDYDSLLDGADDDLEWPEVDENDAAVMCYTTGTTGDPKGVVYSHRSIYLHAMSVTTTAALGVGPSDTTLSVVPMFHANAWGLVHAAFLSGSDLVMPDRFMTGEHLLRLINDTGVTISAGVPTIWADLLRAADSNPDALSSVRTFYGGGSAVPKSMMQQFSDAFDIPLIQGSGMTETSPVVTVAHPPRQPAYEGLSTWDYGASAGRVLAGVEARIVADGQELPAGVDLVGEIEYRGAWVTGEYYQTDATDKFHDGWLRTGDVGFLTEDGYLTILDRTKDVIKSGGEWISSVELETRLAGHPNVREAAVIAIPDDTWGERPLACVVPDGPVEIEALRTFLSAVIPRWQVPEYWTFIVEVPKTSVGKYDKKALHAARSAGDLDVVALAGPRR
jgi:fatty-acyl-CoA synthase